MLFTGLVKSGATTLFQSQFILLIKLQRQWVEGPIKDWYTDHLSCI